MISLSWLVFYGLLTFALSLSSLSCSGSVSIKSRRRRCKTYLYLLLNIILLINTFALSLVIFLCNAVTSHDTKFYLGGTSRYIVLAVLYVMLPVLDTVGLSGASGL